MRNSTIYVPGLLVLGLVLLSVLSPSDGSLLPWLEREDSSLSERFMDPFKILEHVPFGLNRDDVPMVAILARVDWRETANSHEILIDVPGMKKEDLKVEVDDNRILRVSGERRREEEEKTEDHWHRVERSYGKFWRQFRLPENVDLDLVKAKLENGVLVLKFEKLAQEKIKGPKLVSIDQEDRVEEEKEKASIGENRKVEL